MRGRDAVDRHVAGADAESLRFGEAASVERRRDRARARELAHVERKRARFSVRAAGAAHRPRERELPVRRAARDAARVAAILRRGDIEHCVLAHGHVAGI